MASTASLAEKFGAAMRNIGASIATTVVNAAISIAILKTIQFVVEKVDNYVNRVEKAKEAMEDAVSSYEATKSELEGINAELDTQNQKIDELLSKDKLTYVEQGQLKELKEITKELEVQKDINERKLKKERKEAANDAIDTYKKQFGDYDLSKSNIDNISHNVKNTGNADSLFADEDDIAGNIAALVLYREEIESLENKLKDTSGLSDTKIENMGERYQSLVDNVGETEKKLDGILGDLEEQRSAMEPEYDIINEKIDNGGVLSTSEKEILSYYNRISDSIKSIYEYMDPSKWNDMQFTSIFKTKDIEKTKDELIQLSKDGKLNPDTIAGYANLNKAIEESGIIGANSEEKIASFIGQIETLAEAENDLADSSPNQIDISSDAAENIKTYYEELEKAKKAGADLNQTVFGNIDLNDRQVLKWTDQSLEQYKSALQSWDEEAADSWETFRNDMKGSISTVFGASDNFDGVEIAFSPMLQTDHGAVLLSSDTVYDYINRLIEEAKLDDGKWDAKELIRLDQGDSKDFVYNGQQVKNLIADIGDTAIQTGESMHYLGKDGSVQMAFDRVAESAKSAGVSVNELIDAYLNLAPAIDDIKTDVTNFASAQETLTTALSEQSSTETISNETLAKLKEQYEGIENAIEFTTDGIVLNTSKLWELNAEHGRSSSGTNVVSMLHYFLG